MVRTIFIDYREFSMASIFSGNKHKTKVFPNAYLQLDWHGGSECAPKIYPRQSTVKKGLEFRIYAAFPPKGGTPNGIRISTIRVSASTHPSSTATTGMGSGCEARTGRTFPAMAWPFTGSFFRRAVFCS
jgi:hypothetical protein